MDSKRNAPQSDLKKQTIASKPAQESNSNRREKRTSSHSRSTSTPHDKTSPSETNSNPKVVTDSQIEELESTLQEKEQLIVVLTERLWQVAEELGRRQNSDKDSQRVLDENNRVKEQIQELENALEEKELLVIALTERLEQAAEQLDRRHRTGADRGMMIATGVPHEVIEEQQKISQDLQAFLEQTQGSETGESLARIELQINELKQIMEAGFEKGTVSPKPSSLVEYLASPNIESPAEELLNPEQEQSQEPQSTEQVASTSPEQTLDEEHLQPDNEQSASGWEAMKAKLLAGQGVDVSTDLVNTPEPPAAAPLEVQPPPPTEQSFSGSSDTRQRTLASYKPALPAAPLEIQEGHASQDQLIQAIRDRDEYISLLIKRVREAETAVIPVHWEQINNAPAELIEKLQVLHHELEHNLGLAEVEISIERARLSRTESMLQNREEQIRKKEKQMGLNLDRSEEKIEKNELDDEQKKRWLGFLN